MSDSQHDALGKTLRHHGQEHLCDHLATLDSVSAATLRAELLELDWDLMAQLRSSLADGAHAGSLDLKPADTKGVGADKDADAAALARGEALLAGGKVAVFVVAGGQGSRLGFDGPKGMFPATPIRDLTLFQVFAAKIAALSKRVGQSIPWFIMTSTANHEATLAYFESCDFFGLPREDVVLFKQDMLPAMAADGKILLAAPDHLFLSPNGHGGSLLALKKSGSLALMRDRGIEEIFYFQVDNPLVVMADPLFLGYHQELGAQMSTKVVPKRDASEKVGVVGLINGRYGVIEYSDLSQEELAATNESGELLFNDGNIAVHLIRRDFVESLTTNGLDLPFHLARKQIKCLDVKSKDMKEVAGVKFETFVFDALASCKNSLVLSVHRHEEFSPIKNAEGQDSPETSKRAQSELHATWLEKAGLSVGRQTDGALLGRCEIDPKFADSAVTLANKPRAELKDKVAKGGDILLD